MGSGKMAAGERHRVHYVAVIGGPGGVDGDAGSGRLGAAPGNCGHGRLTRSGSNTAVPIRTAAAVGDGH